MDVITVHHFSLTASATYFPVWQKKRAGIPHSANGDVVAAIAGAAVEAAEMPLSNILTRSVLGGVFVGLGGALSASVGGDVPALMATDPGLQRLLFGAIGYPLSIFLVTTLGALAFTGVIVGVGAAWFTPLATGGRAMLSLKDGVRVMGTVLGGNVVGLMAFSALIVAGGMDAVQPCVQIAVHKAAETAPQLVARGVGGGLLVGMAVAQAFAARSGTEKFIGIWMCISTYVACGWAHGLADLFYFPVALMSGAGAGGITWESFALVSLPPVLAGNMCGALGLAAALVAIHTKKATGKGGRR